jgi:hypothetical protein
MVVVPPRADAVLSTNAETVLTQRDCHIQATAEKRRMAWRFHSDQARATEVVIVAQVLNRMLDLGRPDSVRVA